jgi:hypothetical protein
MGIAKIAGKGVACRWMPGEPLHLCSRNPPFMSIHRSSLGLLLIAALLAACATDRTSVNTSHQTSDPRWGRIDSLSDIGQYATALELSDEVRVKVEE